MRTLASISWMAVALTFGTQVVTASALKNIGSRHRAEDFHFQKIVQLGKRHLQDAIHRRFLQETADDQDLVIPPCNTMLGSMTAEELTDVAQGIIEFIAGNDTTSFEYIYLSSVVVAPIQYGVQVHRICAGCEDVVNEKSLSSEETAAPSREVFETFCGPDNYGATNATFSGLLMVPMSEDGTLVSGTLKGVIDMHPTAIAVVPSLMWQVSSNNDNEAEGSMEDLLLQLDAVLCSTSQILIFPDYMGYAENAKELYKGYTIKKAYETSAVPIVLFARMYIRELSDCQTEMSTTVGVKGYSEGGYSAMILADILYRMGWTIVNVHAGGGSYDMIAATAKTYERISNSLYDMEFRHILALVGSSYSSTYTDLPNYERSQDLLATGSRDFIVSLITNSTPEPVVRDNIPYDEQPDVLNLLFNADFLNFLSESVSLGSFDPCSDKTLVELEERQMDLICASFQLNDISAMLQNAPYPVEVCHSRDDEVVPFESVPDLSDSTVNLNIIGGSHNDAAGECIFNALLYFLSQPFQSIVAEPNHFLAGCSSADDGSEGVDEGNTDAFSSQPTSLAPSPTAGPGADAKPTNSTSKATVAPSEGSSGTLSYFQTSSELRTLASLATILAVFSF